MSCPDLGALRASLDHHPDAAPASLHAHVGDCPHCAGSLAELQRNAELAAPAIAMTGPDGPLPPAAVEAALGRLEARRTRLAARTATGGAVAAGPAPAEARGDGPPTARRPRGRLAGLGTRARAAAAALVAAVVLTGLVATPVGRAAASGFLARFRSERFEVVSLDRSQAVQLSQVMNQLLDTGVFSGSRGRTYAMAEPAATRDLAEASRLAGFPVEAVDPAVLPAGVGRTPERVLVMRSQEVRLTFDRDRALDYLRRNGRPDLEVPERYDGTVLVVQVPAAAVQEYAGADGGPRLLVGKAGTLGLDAEGGATLEELRALALRLPGLPPEVVAQLRTIDDWRTTLPLPVPVDEVRWRPATVDGAEALSFADASGRLHALLWQRGGTIWGVAGAIGADQARDVADSLD